MLPLAGANMIKAVREGTEGLTTRRNAPIFYGLDPVLPNMIDSSFRFLGFNPARIAKIREKVWKEKKVGSKYSGRRSDIYARIRKFYLQPIAKRPKGDWIEILEETREYNERVKRKGLTGMVPFITRASIKTSLTRSFRPSKKERIRALKAMT